MSDAHTIEAAIRRVLAARDGTTCCPSEVARALDSEGWRSLMTPVRAVARELEQRGELQILQRGRVVDGARARGPIRLRLPP
ncbi:MAG: DUF3253 domain-containing protein [Deltaproteobacteria bacterium]|nr:DUF3253 domain-containing protein [Nannocystaceae bacterium]